MSDSIVVANSTPIILLQKVGQLELLKALYSKIFIPEAVYKEVIIGGASKNQDDFISAHSFIEIVRIHNVEAKKLFAASLHEGEVETILLAMETKADLCVLDDLLARKYAKSAGFNVAGTLGVLIAAKNKGHIKAVKPVMDELISEGMYVDEALYMSALTIAKEV